MPPVPSLMKAAVLAKKFSLAKINAEESPFSEFYFNGKKKRIITKIITAAAAAVEEDSL
jgi:hypothetical protein